MFFHEAQPSQRNETLAVEAGIRFSYSNEASTLTTVPAGQFAGPDPIDVGFNLH